MNDPHLIRLVQGLREEIADLRRRFGNRLGKESSFALPCYVTSQDYNAGQTLESAWMLGQGEEGQPNANACVLQNYWLRVDRNTDGDDALFSGDQQGRLDLRMNGDDAVLSCNVINPGESINFTTLLDFGNALLRIQRGTDETYDQSFQASLQDPDQYLLSLSRQEFQFFRVTLADDAVTAAWSRTETTGFTLTDAAATTSADLKNVAGAVELSLIADTTIRIATADVAGNACQFNEWTKDGKALTPPLYVLSSGPGDLGGLPCIFQWDADTGSLGIGTDTGCSSLATFQVEMATGFNLTAGGLDGKMQLDGGSGWFMTEVGADENVTSNWHSTGGANVTLGLGSGTNGLYMDFGGGLTVSLVSGDPAGFGSGVHTIKFREIDVCDGGTAKKMIVLGSETY
jgi:hypothetical protein